VKQFGTAGDVECPTYASDWNCSVVVVINTRFVVVITVTDVIEGGD
jgi:hypothetical protein